VRVNLLDIGEEGHEFTLKMGEEEIVDNMVHGAIDGIKDFDFQVRIFKTGDIFTTDGKFTFQKEDQCSWCGNDIVTPVKSKFIEYLMNETRAEHDQKGHAPHSGLNLENEQEVTFVQGYELDLGEFIREQFAIATPNYPKCTDEKACQDRQKENQKHIDTVGMKGHPAFSVLEKLKKH